MSIKQRPTHRVKHGPYRFLLDEGVEVDLVEEVLGRLLGRRRFDGVRSGIAQDSRVDSIRETDVTKVGISADPVIVLGLVRFENEWVTLTRVDLNRVNDQRLCRDAVRLDDSGLWPSIEKTKLSSHAIDTRRNR